MDSRSLLVKRGKQSNVLQLLQSRIQLEAARDLPSDQLLSALKAVPLHYARARCDHFSTEDGDSMFPRNVCYLPEYPHDVESQIQTSTWQSHVGRKIWLGETTQRSRKILEDKNEMGPVRKECEDIRVKMRNTLKFLGAGSKDKFPSTRWTHGTRGKDENLFWTPQETENACKSQA
jgi:hypothetical protein